MNENEDNTGWDRFKNSGKVEDYLKYKKSYETGFSNVRERHP